MTDRPERPGTDVMASLPARRPQRRSSKRGPRPEGNGAAKTPVPPTRKTPASSAKSAKPAAPTAAKATTRRPAAKGAKAPAGRSAAAAKLAAATKPARAGKRPPVDPAPGAIPIDEAPRQPKLKAVRPSDATRRAAPQGARKPPAPDRPAGAPDGLELLGTAIQAAGELAQISLSLGTAALRRAAGRLPRP
jgi:hypothetical protein